MRADSEANRGEPSKERRPKEQWQNGNDHEKRSRPPVIARTVFGVRGVQGPSREAGNKSSRACS